MNFTTQCGENRHKDIANFATLIHKKKLIHCVAIFTILYGNYYPPHGEFKLICIYMYRVNFTQQYGKNRQRFERNKLYYAVWQLLLYYYREFPPNILSVCESHEMKNASILRGEYIFFNICTKTAYFEVSKATWTCEFLSLSEEHRIKTPWRRFSLSRELFSLFLSLVKKQQHLARFRCSKRRGFRAWIKEKLVMIFNSKFLSFTFCIYTQNFEKIEQFNRFMVMDTISQF